MVNWIHLNRLTLIAMVAMSLLVATSWAASIAVPNQSGCCSWHDGVSGYCSAGGRVVCNDGELSPSCTCTPYLPSPASGLPQTITIRFLPDINVGGSGIVDVVAGSGGPVTLSSSTPLTCSVFGHQVNGIAEGICTIVGNQDGDRMYRPAPQAIQSLAVGPAIGSLTVNLTPIEFPAQSINTTAPERVVAVTNTGPSLLVLSWIDAVSPFAVTRQCSSLQPGESCTVGVTFAPLLEGPLMGSLDIGSNAGIARIPLFGTGEKSLVTHYYNAILRRSPDEGGKAYWEAVASQLPAWGANVNETWFAMAMYFYSSAEYQGFNRSDMGFVSDLYRTFFNRAPDAGGLNYWVGALGRGMPRELVLAQFMFSSEFATFTQAIFGLANVRAEVTVVMDFYRGLLGRLPDKGGFDNWLAQIRSAQCIDANAVRAVVDAISQQFLTGGEYLGRGRSNAQFVGDLYNSFLRRGGDEVGVAHWITRLNLGDLTREQERAMFLASPEFAGRVNAVVAEGCLR